MPFESLEVCNTLWIGGDLGPVAVACLASFVRHGHRVVLHCYDVPKDVPTGVEIADAAKTVPSHRIIRHKETGSYALFANLFRYELLRRSAGLWIDCDVYCVRPIVARESHIFGWESVQTINNAVLKLPADSPVLTALINLFDEISPVPPWLPPQDRMTLLQRAARGETFTLSDLPWGSAGPLALTFHLMKAGLTGRARQRRVFYPVSYQDGPLLIRRGDLARHISATTLTVHLWNEPLKKVIHLREPGSPIDRLLNDGTLFDEVRRMAS